jgi:hypothetical protein
VEAAVKMETDVQNTKAFLNILDSFISPSSNIFKVLKKELEEKIYSPEEFKNRIKEICIPYQNDISKNVPRKRWKGQQYTYWEAIKKAIELEAKIGDPQALMLILDNIMDSQSKEYQTILLILGIKIEVADINKEKQFRSSKTLGILGELFPSLEQEKEESTIVKSTYRPIDADNLFYISTEIERMLQGILTESQLKDAKWFFSEIRKPAAQRGYYKEVDVLNNKWVIDLFCKYLAKRMELQRVDNIRMKFYNMYGIR